MPAPVPPVPPHHFDTVILAYSGVIGLTPSPGQWGALAGLAGWPRMEVAAFRQQYHQRLPAYQENLLSTADFWTALVHPEQRQVLDGGLLAALRQADTHMWTSIDPDMTEVLRLMHTTGTPVTLLADVPWPVADAIEGTEWRATLIARTVFSSQTGVTKPAERAFDAACVAARARPEHTLYVDGSRRNLDAAARFGLKVFHYTGDPAELADHLPRGPAGEPDRALVPMPGRPSLPAPLTSVMQLRAEEGLQHGAGTRKGVRAHRRTGLRPRNRSNTTSRD